MAADSATATSLWRRLDRWLAGLETSLLVLLLMALIGVGCVQVVLRNVVGGGLPEADPLMRVAVLWIGLVGALVATRQGRHVSIDLLSRYLSPAQHRWCRRATDGFTAVVCALVAWHGARLVYVEYTDPTLAFSGLPVWAAQSIIPIGFGLIALRFALCTVFADAVERRR